MRAFALAVAAHHDAGQDAVDQGAQEILVAATDLAGISSISSNCVSVRSGAIFSKIGFGAARFLFSACSCVSSCVSGSFSCKARKLGVFGDDTLTTK